MYTCTCVKIGVSLSSVFRAVLFTPAVKTTAVVTSGLIPAWSPRPRFRVKKVRSLKLQKFINRRCCSVRNSTMTHLLSRGPELSRSVSVHIGLIVSWDFFSLLRLRAWVSGRQPLKWSSLSASIFGKQCEIWWCGFSTVTWCGNYHMV